MTRIEKAFENENALIAFVTGGDPDLETTKKLLIEMENSGADLIEVGIPFSDPVAEGPVIQEANERALSNGCTTDKLFDTIKEARNFVKLPIVFVTYLNPIYTYGTEKFMTRCEECGIDGVIVPDLPFEEKEEFAPTCKKHNIDLISLIAPASGERISMIAKEAAGFLYCISSLDACADKNALKVNCEDMISKLRKVSDIPCAFSFEISTPEQAADISQYSDGIIIGSAIVKIIADYGKESVPYVGEYVKQIKNSIN